MTSDEAIKRLNNLKKELEAIGSGDIQMQAIREDCGPGCFTIRLAHMDKSGNEIVDMDKFLDAR